MRLLSFDVGERRTGVAAGDDLVRLVQPLTVVEAPRGPALLDALAQIVEDHGPDAIVVGLPLNMDGSDGAAATSMRSFAVEIAARMKKPVHLQDERLSSADADARMARTGRTHGQKKALRDALAAAAILEDFLRERG